MWQWVCDLWHFSSQSTAATTKVTFINILCCVPSNCHALCENMTSFLLNTCAVSDIVKHVKFAKTDTLHCKVPGSIWNYMFGNSWTFSQSASCLYRTTVPNIPQQPHFVYLVNFSRHVAQSLLLLHKLPCVSECYLLRCLKYSHFTYRVH